MDYSWNKSWRQGVVVVAMVAGLAGLLRFGPSLTGTTSLAPANIVPASGSGGGGGDSKVIATVGQPAAFTVARPAGGPAGVLSGQPSRVIVEVTGYQPAQDGPVQAVVKVMQAGAAREIGRFAVLPQAAFVAGKPQRFAVTLPRDLAGAAGPLDIQVHLVPASGAGLGASLEVAGVVIN